MELPFDPFLGRLLDHIWNLCWNFSVKCEAVFSMRIWDHICINFADLNNNKVAVASHQMCCKHRQACTDSTLQFFHENTGQALLASARVPNRHPFLKAFDDISGLGALWLRVRFPHESETRKKQPGLPWRSLGARVLRLPGTLVI